LHLELQLSECMLPVRDVTVPPERFGTSITVHADTLPSSFAAALHHSDGDTSGARVSRASELRIGNRLPKRLGYIKRWSAALPHCSQRVGGAAPRAVVLVARGRVHTRQQHQLDDHAGGSRHRA
jgi:hypothetical protein